MASKAVVRGANTHMRFRDFHTMSQLPAFLPGAFIAAQANDGSTNAGPTAETQTKTRRKNKVRSRRNNKQAPQGGKRATSGNNDSTDTDAVRPNLYMINGNLEVFMPEFAAQLFNGSLVRRGELLQQLVERYKSARDSNEKSELNLWMGTDATTSGLHYDAFDNWLCEYMHAHTLTYAHTHDHVPGLLYTYVYV